eukprot:5736401-Prymnesium_polylepis.1
MHARAAPLLDLHREPRVLLLLERPLLLQLREQSAHLAHLAVMLLVRLLQQRLGLARLAHRLFREPLRLGQSQLDLLASLHLSRRKLAQLLGLLPLLLHIVEDRRKVSGLDRELLLELLRLLL